jgi:hypothetical protein
VVELEEVAEVEEGLVAVACVLALEDDTFAAVVLVAGEAAGLVAELDGAISDIFGAVAVPSLDFEPLPSPRKSVTYQPLPLSAKPAAVTCLVNVSCPQAVQVRSGASLILRKMSCAWLQLEQR